MLDEEPNLSIQLNIAGCLWKLNKDPIFIDRLQRAKVAGLFWDYFHLLQVLWLGDERAVDLFDRPA
jgi:hypothetical protein